MANITLKDITPIHFLNAVRLLKADDYRVYCTLDTIEIRFDTNLCEHLAAFLTELKNSSVPVDKEEFIKVFSPAYPKRTFHKRK